MSMWIYTQEVLWTLMWIIYTRSIVLFTAEASVMDGTLTNTSYTLAKKR